jgi:hypothetical protein
LNGIESPGMQLYLHPPQRSLVNLRDAAFIDA